MRQGLAGLSSVGHGNGGFTWPCHTLKAQLNSVGFTYIYFFFGLCFRHFYAH